MQGDTRVRSLVWDGELGLVPRAQETVILKVSILISGLQLRLIIVKDDPATLVHQIALNSHCRAEELLLPHSTWYHAGSIIERYGFMNIYDFSQMIRQINNPKSQLIKNLIK